MKKNVLIISTSLRLDSHSEKLADAFMQGALKSGHHVEKISLKDKNIAFCRGCLACQQSDSCVIKDDAIAITEKMKNTDVAVFATPIYYYEMSGQMKTLLDRMNALYHLDYAFRDIYLLTTAAEDESYVPQRAINGLEGWIECFDNVKLKGSVFAGGADSCVMEEHKALKEAYELGKNL